MQHTLKLTHPVAAGPLLDIRLAMEDAGLWGVNRVKDANGWRDANAWENQAGGIQTPKHGYIPKYANGTYTESGKYELTVEVAAHTVAPTKQGKGVVWLETTYHATRAEARAALLQHLNAEHQEPELYERRHFEYCPDQYESPHADEAGVYLTQYGKYEVFDRVAGAYWPNGSFVVCRRDCDGIDIGTASTWEEVLRIVNDDAQSDRAG